MPDDKVRASALSKLAPEQIENAAEIALEHHLGMTCDPIGGLVQVPCTERNALGTVKAVTAASLAMKGDGTHFVPLDACIETMRQTGHDMSEQYKGNVNRGTGCQRRRVLISSVNQLSNDQEKFHKYVYAI